MKKTVPCTVLAALALAFGACGGDDEAGGSREGGAGTATTTTEAAKSSAGIPEGTYRTEVSVDELVKQGMDPSTAREYNGVHTLELRDGKLEDLIKSDKPFPVCRGTYESTATTLELTFADANCSGGLTAKWELRGDTLHLKDIKTGSPEEDLINTAVFGTKPWKKIG